VPRQFSNRALVSLVASLALVMAAMTRGGAAGAAPPVKHTVAIEGTAFVSADLTVNAGDTVVWVNRDPYPHTATSKTAGFDSRDIAPGKSWTYTAKTKGDFAYLCAIHPSMQGTLHVK
jgi:plastocyanin